MIKKLGDWIFKRRFKIKLREVEPGKKYFILLGDKDYVPSAYEIDKFVKLLKEQHPTNKWIIAPNHLVYLYEKKKTEERIARWFYKQARYEGQMVGDFKEHKRTWIKEARKIMRLIK